MHVNDANPSPARWWLPSLPRRIPILLTFVHTSAMQVSTTGRSNITMSAQSAQKSYSTVRMVYFCMSRWLGRRESGERPR